MTQHQSTAPSERVHWTVRAVGWQLIAAVAATVAEYAMRLTLWAQDRSKASR